MDRSPAISSTAAGGPRTSAASSAALVPFTLQAKGEELAFHGAGPAPASPAERRMIATWAHLVVAEAVAGRGGSAYATVLSWHRSADAGGECDEVRVDLTGEVRAGPCGRPGTPAW